MSNNKNGARKVSGIPVEETFWQKARRKAETAVAWGKTHWKGLALGAVALGGGAYLLSKRNGEDEATPTGGNLGSGPVDYVGKINDLFDGNSGSDGSDVGPDDDYPDDEAE